MHQLLPAQTALLDTLVNRLRDVRGIAAIVLGGSHARGAARPDSDLDIGILHDPATPLDTAAPRLLAAEVNDAPDPVVTEINAWGKWVDGGAWLTIGGQRVDFLYRSTALIDQVLADAAAGQFTIDHEQQPPFGFFSPTVLGEVAIAAPLHDPGGIIPRYQAKVSPMPEPLRLAVIQQMLWSVDFGLKAFVPKYAAAGNVYALAGCLTRFSHALVLALFALNGRYLLNDKTALTETREFSVAPHDFANRVTDLLSAIGRDAHALEQASTAMARLLAETAELAGERYRPSWQY